MFLDMAVERSGGERASAAPHQAGGTVALQGLKLGVWQSVDIGGLMRHGWTRLTIRLDAPAPPGTRLLGMIFNLGMIFDCREAPVVAGDGADPTCTFVFALTPQLFIRRGITKVVLRVIVVGSEPDIPWGNAHPDQ